jgi:xylulokinase
MYYIGLDIGTSGCKATVMDAKGAVVAYADREYSTTAPKPGYIEIDGRVVYGAAKAVLAEVARPEITAIAIASFGEAVVLLGSNDDVLAGSIYFSDVRGSEEVADITAALSVETITRITGMPPNPMFTANKLLWTKKHEPDLYAKAEKILSYGDYIAYMLTGERAVDYSLASRTMLFDVRKLTWSEEVADALGLGLSLKRFSTPVRSGSIIGKIRKDVSVELGLPEGVLLVAGGHDQPLAALGSGAVYPGDSADGMGSSECLSVVLKDGNVDPLMARYNFCCEPHVVPGAYVTLAFNASAGSAIKWFCGVFEPERTKRAAEEGGSIYRILDEECPDEPTNLLFLPYVSGSGTPWFDTRMGGAYVGLRQGVTKQELYKAVLEGVCYEIRYNERLLAKCNMTIDEIRASGGGTRSDVLMQIKADIMNRDIHALSEWQTGTIGLALICAKAMGEIDDLAIAAKRIAKIEKIYRPDPERARHYIQGSRRYMRLYTSIQSLDAIGGDEIK